MMRGLFLERHMEWTPGLYSAWRMIFGGYLCLHFLQLLPWAMELWSNVGVLPHGGDSPLQLPVHLYALSDRPLFVTVSIVVAALLSLQLALGIADRTAAFLLWYILASLLARNPLISNPGIPFVGWLLLAHIVVPPVRTVANELPAAWPPQPRWRMPPALWASAWAIMALSYSYSGYHKLQSQSWVDGTALMRMLDSPLVRDTLLREVLQGLHEYVLGFLTWAALALELLYAPLALIRALRPWLWLGMVLMHLALLMLADFVDLSLAMLMIHFFTFNPGWLTLRVPLRRRAWRMEADASA
ncbi:MAG TPA: hypothetical protein VEC57_06225 [Candidatus Limnocylindrales bacterium]|nr:hypothetical protein [Candidatus Limnocylindrales bacterium]